MAKIIESYWNKNLKVFNTFSNDYRIVFTLNIMRYVKLDECTIIYLCGFHEANNLNSGFQIDCRIPHEMNPNMPDAHPAAFKSNMIFVNYENKYDPENTNFGKFMAKNFNTPTENAKFRNCNVPVDVKMSINFQPDHVADSKVTIFLRDVNRDHLLNFKIDWPEKRVIFDIPRKNLSTFIYYFLSEEQLVPKELPKIPECGKVIKEIEVRGFDSFGEPRIEIHDNGTVELYISFMPPINGTDDRDFEPFEYFDKELEFATGTLVVWDDREHFIFPAPDKKTVKRLKRYLEYYWDPYLKSDKEYLRQDIYGAKIKVPIHWKLLMFFMRIPLEIGAKLVRMRTVEKRNKR